MRETASNIFIILLMALLSACGADKEFRINGNVDGFGTGNLRLVYYNGEGVQSLAATAIDGKFTVTGRLDKEVLLRIYTNNGNVVGRLLVAPGETVEAEFNISDPTKLKISGNDSSERLAKFIKDNGEIIRAGDTRTLNSAIEKYVTDNPRRAVSGALMADFYSTSGNEIKALELIGLLERDARNAAALDGLRDMLMDISIPNDSLTLGKFRVFGPGDTLNTIDPASSPLTLISVTDTESRKTDSVANAMEIIIKSLGKKLYAADISADPDTAAWRRSLRALEANGKTPEEIVRYWSPSPFNIEQFSRMPVERLPWFIVADSTGQVIYRGASVSAARNALTKN